MSDVQLIKSKHLFQRSIELGWASDNISLKIFYLLDWKPKYLFIGFDYIGDLLSPGVLAYSPG